VDKKNWKRVKGSDIQKIGEQTVLDKIKEAEKEAKK